MFVDQVKITAKAGSGGNGAVSFHREKFVQNGGPDGGDGGNGGSVILVADGNMHTLLDFRFKSKYFAENGEDGSGGRCTGKRGEDLIVKVPVGTVVRGEDGRVVADMFEDGQKRVLLHGGRGGWGNQHFATPTRQAPNFAKPGVKTQSFKFTLELKTIADVGLVGFPNVGKSTILSVVTRAQPKIANYHFTTLTPNLGIVRRHGMDFVLADIPGLVEGAADGAGLGHDFLRHVERTRLLIHVLDMAGSEGRDPIEDFDTINAELQQYSEDLASRPQIVVANKTDLLADREQLDAFRAHVEALGYAFMEMSAATHQGTRELVRYIAAQLQELPPVIVYEPEYVKRPPEIDTSEPLDIQRDGDTWLVEGPWLQRLMGNINFSDYESRMYFDKMLRQSGLFDTLECMGIQDGHIVSMYNLEFEYQR